MEMFFFASAVRGYCVYQDLWKPSIGEELVAKREFNNPMDKYAVKVKGDKTVGHLSRKFSQITQYFQARSGEIRFEVNGLKQCGGLEVQCQLEFSCSNESTNETLKELLASKIWVQNCPEDSKIRLLQEPLKA